MSRCILDGESLKVASLLAVAFQRESSEGKQSHDLKVGALRQRPVEISASTFTRVEKSHHDFLALLEARIPIYGVTTGFGDSGDRTIAPGQSEQLQHNLVSYLLCGTGKALSRECSRAILAVRLNSMCRALSGVSRDLVERMQLYLQNDWVPVIPREGSLGASGDLIPLAYLARVLEGEGEVYSSNAIRPIAQLLKEQQLEPYKLKAKEGLALVNGTSAMAGLFAVNLNHARFLLDWLCLNTSWLTLALQGRTEAFGELVNERAKTSAGQAWVAKQIRELLNEENYRSKPLADIRVQEARTSEWVQDRYSLRCAPQIAGPIFDTMQMLQVWLEKEINSASDNPLVGGAFELANGGNFYGGYMSQGMDYLKISLAHIADTVDRQVTYIVDDKSNRGLPTNLANWPGLPEGEKHLHHGLKGLHQAINAITSEIMQKATPGGIFSRSSESHNQDKVSLGMSAAVQCSDLLESLFTTLTLQSVVLAQAIDLRGIALQGETSTRIYKRIRSVVPFVAADQALGSQLEILRLNFIELSCAKGELVNA